MRTPFWARVKIGEIDECWPWLGSINPYGYGVVRISTKAEGRARGGTQAIRMAAHRRAYSLSRGPVPDEADVCHRCDNRRCCNPGHLFIGSRLDNMRDAASKGRVARGESHYAAKLSDAEVEEIRASSEPGVILARRYGVWPSAISRIRNGTRRRLPAGIGG